LALTGGFVGYVGYVGFVGFVGHLNEDTHQDSVFTMRYRILWLICIGPV